MRNMEWKWLYFFTGDTLKLWLGGLSVMPVSSQLSLFMQQIVMFNCFPPKILQSVAGRFLEFHKSLQVTGTAVKRMKKYSFTSLPSSGEFILEKLVKRFFRTLLRGSTSLWLVDPPVKGWISIDRSLVAALPSTIPWPVLKSSTNGSAIPKPCVTQRLCYLVSELRHDIATTTEAPGLKG